MLPSADWLHLAERLAVGASARVQHHCGAGAPLVVYNNTTGYSAWCHRCQLGGFRSKEYVRYSPVQQESLRSTLPWDAVPFLDAGQAVQATAYRFFVGKGLDPNMLPVQNMLWCARTYRVIFKHPQGASGRVLQEGVHPKWVEYYCNGAVGAYAEFGDPSASTVVLTEDILSAIKYAYACSCRAVALLGTKLDPSLQVRQGATVWIALDGDAAGAKGAACTRRRLEFRGIKSHVVQIPEGKDPKDLTIRELRESLMCQT